MIILIRVKPGAKTTSRLEKMEDGSYVAYVRERAKDGEANAGLVKLVAEYFGVRKSEVKIKTGAGARIKRVEVG